MSSLPMLSPSMTFDQAAAAVLAYLRDEVPMGLWSVTRVENDRQSYLYLGDNDYGLLQGESHPWQESFCIHMAAGTAPSVAPDVASVPVYARAKVGERVRIGAYAGAVISEPDGLLFGALCGINQEGLVGDERLTRAEPLLALLGQLLSMVLAADRERERLSLLAVTASLEAEQDALTGLWNRRAWNRLLEDESARFSRFGDPTVLAMIDLDLLKEINDEQGHAAGDAYIRRAAAALQAAVRDGDLVARLGGDEFGVLMRGCSEASAQDRVAAIYASQEAADVAGSVGWAPITVLRGFPAALAEADEAMYAAKRDRRRARASVVAQSPGGDHRVATASS